MDIALFEPDIPQNTAAILRTAVCFDAAVHIVGPAAFDLSERATRRAGLDYAATARLKRHTSFDVFKSATPGRIVLFTTRASTTLDAFAFAPGDTLLFGRESAGVPDAVHDACDERVRIPLARGARSLNLAVAVAVGLWQALSSTNQLDPKGLT